MTHRLLGPLMVDIAGLTLTTEDCEILRHPLVGGVILFTRNYENPAQVAALVGAIRALREPQLLIAADYEGGRVQRFRQGGFTVLPPARAFGRLYDQEPERAKALARDCGWMIGAELCAIGIDLCFAPVLDVETGLSAVIGDRAFHAGTEAVTELGLAMMLGLRAAGMAATGKHFPGHGHVAEDSHHALPVDERTLDEIREQDMPPFQALIRHGLPSVMMAHILFPKVDAQPASLSRRWIADELRGRMGFDGVVFCDDLSMRGAAVIAGLAERAAAALEAGCDMLPKCNNRPAVMELLDRLRVTPDAISASRLEKLRAAPGRTLAELQSQPAWKNAHDSLTALV